MNALPNAAAFPGHQTADGPIRDGDDQDELPLEQQPKFTEQDEQRELATLTVQELTELQSDLTGIQAITNGFSGIGLGLGSAGINVYGGESPASRGSSPPRPLSTHLLLAALDQHMMTLPTQSVAAYFRATVKCPDEVSDERKLMFLQCEENNVPLAAERLALYWQYRLNGFGEDRCFEPMTLAGAMRDEITNMTKSGVVQLMPNTDAAGRAIIYSRMGRRDYALYSVKQEVMWLTYLLEIVVQHQSLQSRGFVLLVDMSNATGRQRTRQSQQYMQRAINGAFPIRNRSIHGCNVSPLLMQFLVPVFRRFATKSIRLRTRVHRGSGEDLLRSLAEYSLPRDRVPSDLGGSVVLDVNQFIIDRFQLEASQAGVNLQVAETGSVDQADRTGTTLSSAAHHHNQHGQAPPIHGPSVGAAAAAVTRIHTNPSSSKRTGPRNIADPRMVKAVRAKQDDPDLSLYDALISGGFSFTKNGPGSTDYDFFDENDVSLKQRKNNLCRRLATLSSAARHHNQHGKAPPIHGPSVGAAAAAVSRIHTNPSSSKRTGPRNIADPRMVKAVRAKQDDPDLSLYDALISGGFSFTKNGPGSTDYDFFDEHDVSLKQRKNNLCRRLKKEKEKQEKKRARKTGDDGTTSVTRNIASEAATGRRDSLDEGGLGSPGRPDDKDVASILLHFKRST